MSTLRLSTAGESHGPAEVCVLTGVPAGLALAPEDIDTQLARRQHGHGRGGRMVIETDRCVLLSGVRLGVTLGTPIAVLVENRDHANWLASMSPLAPSQEHESPAQLTVPRPGHADLTGLAKYGHRDIRNVLERASARETVGRVAGGAICRRLLSELGVTVRGRVTAIGAVSAASEPDLMDPASVDWEAVESSAVGCDDPETSDRMCSAIDGAGADGESLGGIFEIWCWGLAPGLGGYATPDDRLDGRLMGALGSIPAIKGVEVGHGFANAGLRGSQVHDPIILAPGPKTEAAVARASNRAAGLEGGMSTGLPIVLRAAMKPIPTLTTPLPSVDLSSMQAVAAHYERSDVTAVPAARVVAEAMVSYVLAGAYLEKFGGDSIESLLHSLAAYSAGLEGRGLWRRS